MGNSKREGVHSNAKFRCKFLNFDELSTFLPRLLPQSSLGKSLVYCVPNFDYLGNNLTLSIDYC